MAPESDSAAAPTEEKPTGEHKLRRRWHFQVRPRDVSKRKTQSSSNDWQKEFVAVGEPVGTVEKFWLGMNEVFKRLMDSSVFLFEEGVAPMWEDPAFENGATVNFGFSGPEYVESARQSFLLISLLMIGSQFDEPEDAHVRGCTLGWKTGHCRVDVWLSSDDPDVMTRVAKRILAGMADFHQEFYRCLQTRVSYDCKAFRAGGEKRGGGRAEDMTLEQVVRTGGSLSLE